MDTRTWLKKSIDAGLLYDPEDEEFILRFYWEIVITSAGPKSYTTIDAKAVYMARLLLNAPADRVVDHINGNGLDNRRSNLRICTNQQNCMNQKPRNGRNFKGVSKLPSGKWRARVTIDGAHFHLGVFKSEQLAALEYNKAAIRYYGEYARLNILPEDIC